MWAFSRGDPFGPIFLEWNPPFGWFAFSEDLSLPASWEKGEAQKGIRSWSQHIIMVFNSTDNSIVTSSNNSNNNKSNNASWSPSEPALLRNSAREYLRSARVRADDDRAWCWNKGHPYKRAYALSSCALTYVAPRATLSYYYYYCYYHYRYTNYYYHYYYHHHYHYYYYHYYYY